MVRTRWGRWRRMGLVGTGWMGLLAVAAPGGWAQLEGVDVGLAGYAPAHVRADFTAGVRALHNFWWEEAEDRFAAVVEQAPEFPLGYWGRAMALHTNPFGHQRPPVDSMLALLAPLGETREDRLKAAGSAPVRDYLEALETLLEAGDAARLHPAYVEAMARLAQRYPADLEAQAFYARALLLNEPVWGRATTTWPVAVSASRAVLDRDPDHPGALHYLIHALDRPETAVDGLDAAERYARVRTGASHAVHMPSHIYMQSGMWERVIEGNRRALEVSREFMARTGRDARSLDAHAVDFLVYALLQTGRWNAAEELIGEFREHRETFQSGALRWYDGLWSAVFALHTGRGPADSLPRSGYASLNESLVQVALAVRAGDPEAVAAADEALQALAAERDAPDWRLAAAQSSALVHRAHRRFDQAVEVLRPALRIQQEMVRPNETPSPVLPPEEQLAEDLFQLGRFEEAVRALDALDARWPRRIRALHLRARIAARAGDGEEARRRYEEIMEQLRGADSDHPVADEARRFLVASRFDGRGRLDPGALGEVAERGEGPKTLILIPCMSCRWRSYDGFMDRNKAKYRMFAVTLPGFGGTPMPDLPMNSGEPLWHENATAALENLIDREGLGEVYVVGHSWGGDAAAHLAARRPDVVRGLILLDADPSSDLSWFESSDADRRLQALGTVGTYGPQYQDLDTWQAFNGVGSYVEPDRRLLYHGWFMATPRDAVLQYWSENSLSDLSQVYRSLDIPILDLKSISPAATDPQAVREARARYWETWGRPDQVTTVFLEDTGHHVLEHRPDVVDREVARFLEGMGAGSP